MPESDFEKSPGSSWPAEPGGSEVQLTRILHLNATRWAAAMGASIARQAELTTLAKDIPHAFTDINGLPIVD